ncbi:MAG: hypothetical protein L6R39_006869 [Caloplaca ligustica]|nr:MAG: hypothetical protein L6R39_006869 [Caloplaca ligustica]
MASSGPPATNDTSFSGLLNANSGRAAQSSGQSITNFLASLFTAFGLFGAQLLLFLVMKHKLFRIYRPRTYLVPERERTRPPPEGLWQWLVPVFKTSNSDFISKCGLDAYFFLRYLRMLLKIFVPLAFLILPILIPVNIVHGRGNHFAVGKYAHNNTVYTNVTGLDLLAWGNVRPDKNNRYWVHLVLAIVVISYTCFVFFDELRGYIRLRQSYLTSPQHRLRASATTVLVTAIPRKWCTHEALDGLYDVFPGGIRNIWVNRDYDELNEKVKLRNKLASKLESAMTDLIRNAKKAHLAKLKKDAKKAPRAEAKEKVAGQTEDADQSGKALAMRGGISAGDPHQTRHTLDEALDEADSSGSRASSRERRKNRLIPIPILEQGVEVVGHGINNLGKTVFRGLKQVERDVDGRLINHGGFVPDDGEQNQTRVQYASPDGLPASTRGSDETLPHTSADGPADHVDGPQSRNNNSGSHGDHLEVPESYELTPETAYSPQSPHDAYSDSRIRGPTERPAQVDGAKTHGRISNLKFWRQGKNVPFGIPSPTPHGYEGDEFPLSDRQAPANKTGEREAPQANKGGLRRWIPFISSPTKEKKPVEYSYPAAYDKEYDPEEGEPLWKQYLKDSDRDSMRLPIFGWQWMPSLPLLGQKVDTIDYCRKEVARLNVEIEQDQKEPEKFPLMNSAFIQFNHQVAAHMACQSVSHHTPQQMTPRIVEISPDDVIWDNMSVKWWENYIRTAAVILVTAALILGWAIPVGFTGILGNLDSISHQLSWLRWVQRLPRSVLGIISGVLPQALLSGLLALLPLILRFLCKSQGNHTGMAVELAVQNYYFAFLFIQVFLVVSISSGFTNTITQLSSNPTNVPGILAANLPRSTNYFFSYMLLQALTVSAAALSQFIGLLKWFFLAPIVDSTGRQKWRRQTDLSNINWGSFFPVYTNLAAIGLIYSVISPLIMVFNITTFSLFWLVYRYNTLYVTKFRFDTGGLLFPKAINQLFTGLYVMELCLIGLFFLVRDANANGDSVGTPCKGQAIIMIVVLILTVLYQFLLNKAFGPLFRYLPITLEDEAVIRDEEFARAQEKRWRLADGEREGDDINDLLEERERRSLEESRKAEEVELKEIEARRERPNSKLEPRNLDGMIPDAFTKMLPLPKKGAWAERSRQRARSRASTVPQVNNMLSPGHAHAGHHHHHQSKNPTDIEAQRSGTKIGEALFSGLNDEIEDLTPEERDKLVQRAFQHSALRARRPVIWIPRDDLGVSDDEIRRTQKFSEHIWISNEYIGLDGKCRVIYRKSPPDFSEVDLIEL